MDSSYPRTLCNSFIVTAHAYAALEQCKGGAVIECGVYDGVTSAALNYALRHSQYFTRQIACDTFEGFPYEPSENEKRAFKEGGLKPYRKEKTISELKRLGIDVLEGRVEHTIPTIEKDLRYAFVFLDLDLAEPTEFCIRAISGKVLPGGRIGFHDYDENPRSVFAGIAQLVKKKFLTRAEWKEVRREKKRDGRFIFFERTSVNS